MKLRNPRSYSALLPYLLFSLVFSAFGQSLQPGDLVIVVDGPLNVRDQPGLLDQNGNRLTPLGSQMTGALGTIRGGPESKGGFMWWDIDYHVKRDGWSAQGMLTDGGGTFQEEYLAKVDEAAFPKFLSLPARTSG